MKIEFEMTDEHLNLLIKSVEIYARSLMSQADIVADILAEDKYSYDEEDPNRREKFDKWLKDREEMTKNLSAAFCAMFGKYPMKSDTCENLIDIWHVLRHLQYQLQKDNKEFDSNHYDVRACEPFQVGTEPLMVIKRVSDEVMKNEEKN